MAAISKKQGEKDVLDSLLATYPEFLGANLIWEPGPDPPDFFATSKDGRKIGLELTEWLDNAQTTRSISNRERNVAILAAIDSEHTARPKSLTQVLICDRSDVPFQKRDLRKYVQELYRFIEKHADCEQEDLPIPIWGPTDLAEYPVLNKYCIGITLYGAAWGKQIEWFDWSQGGIRWIDFEPVGGAYDPQWSVNALLSRIDDKTCRYEDMRRNYHLDHFALLAHYGIRGIIHNTPYRGRAAGLDDAAMQAHKKLLSDHGAFDSAYLYMNFNGGKLIKLFPEFVTLKEYSHQPGQH